MCFICRNTYNKNELLRLVKTSAGEILIDKTGKANGRGAYICKCEKCIEQIKKQKILSKAFKCEFPPAVYKKLCEELIDKQ
ncbi:MAG: YlxR family protein [Clostridia bacterium]|nr:YlxR family protein [Clostridia bacterium]